jgi:hypothetical protein
MKTSSNSGIHMQLSIDNRIFEMANENGRAEATFAANHLIEMDEKKKQQNNTTNNWSNSSLKR